MNTFTLWRADESTDFEPVKVADVRVSGTKVDVAGAEPELAALLSELGRSPVLPLTTTQRAPDAQRLTRREIGPEHEAWGFALGDEAARRTGLEVVYGDD